MKNKFSNGSKVAGKYSLLSLSHVEFRIPEKSSHFSIFSCKKCVRNSRHCSRVELHHDPNTLSSCPQSEHRGCEKSNDNFFFFFLSLNFYLFDTFAHFFILLVWFYLIISSIPSKILTNIMYSVINYFIFFFRCHYSLSHASKF